MEFHVARAARQRYDFDEGLFSLNGNVVFPNFAASRRFDRLEGRVFRNAREAERAARQLANGMTLAA